MRQISPWQYSVAATGQSSAWGSSVGTDSTARCSASAIGQLPLCLHLHLLRGSENAMGWAPGMNSLDDRTTPHTLTKSTLSRSSVRGTFLGPRELHLTLSPPPCLHPRPWSPFCSATLVSLRSPYLCHIRPSPALSPPPGGHPQAHHLSGKLGR